MDSLASTEIFGGENKTCDKCGMHITKSNGCCRDEVKIIKMVDDQKVTAYTSFELPALNAVVQLPSEFITASFVNANESRDFQNHSPPIPPGQDIYLQNCVFRI